MIKTHTSNKIVWSTKGPILPFILQINFQSTFKNRLNLFHLQFDSWEIYFQGDSAAEEASYRALHSIEPLMNNFEVPFDESYICRLLKFSNFLELSLKDSFNFKKVRIRSFSVSIHLKNGSICKLWSNVTQYNTLLPH